MTGLKFVDISILLIDPDHGHLFLLVNILNQTGLKFVDISLLFINPDHEIVLICLCRLRHLSAMWQKMVNQVFT